MPKRKPIVVIAAMGLEIEPLQRRLAQRASGISGAPPVRTICFGMGARRAKAWVRRIIPQERPACLILIGFAGGLDPALAPGAVLHIGQVMDESGRGFRVGDIPQAIKGEHRPEQAELILLTTDDLVDSPVRKAALREKWGAAAVDMESFHVAQAAAELGIPLHIFRAISDPVQTALPRRTLNWVHVHGAARPAKAALDLLRRPCLLPVMLELRRNSRRAGEALAEAAERLILDLQAGSKLPPP